jgi:hypothetical protein
MPNEELKNKILDLRLIELKSIKRELMNEINNPEEFHKLCVKLLPRNSAYLDDFKIENNIKIVFGYGGGQNNTIDNLIANGENYIHITPDMITYEKDKERGF